jgi:hypothetical protein
MRKRNKRNSFVPKKVAFARVGCGNTKGYEYLATGLLIGKKVGTRLVIDEDSIDALIESLPPFVSKSPKAIPQPAATALGHNGGPPMPPEQAVGNRRAPSSKPKRPARPLAVAKARARARGHRSP